MSLRRSEGARPAARVGRRSRVAGVRLGMQAALLRVFAFPPPAAGAEVLAERDRARAGGAADAGIERVVQPVVGHLVPGDVVPYVAPAPVGERAYLDAAVGLALGVLDLGAVARLLAAQPGDPGVAAGHHAAQRFELAQRAAGLAQLDAAVHRARAVALDELQHRLVGRAVDVHRQAVALLDAADQRQRLRMQLARVERRQRNRQPVARDQVGDDHVLGAQAGGLHDAAGMRLGGSAQHLQRALQLGVETGAGAGVQRDGREAAHAATRSRAKCGRGSSTSP